MSRSYKKHPCGGDKKSKFNKKYSNHIIRQKLKDLNFKIHHSDYKKVFSSYDICDFWCYHTWEQQKEFLYKIYGELTEEELNKRYREWYKWYKRK